MALLLLAAVKALRSKGRIWLVAPLLLAVGLLLSPNATGSSWLVWGCMGLAAAVGIGLIGVLCLKLGWAIVPGLVAAEIFLEQVEAILLRPFPGSLSGAVLGIGLVAVAVYFWTRALQQPGPDPGVGSSS